MGEQGRTDEVNPNPIDRLGGFGSRVLGLVDSDLDRRRTPASVGRGSVNADPAILGEPRLPAPPPLDLVGQIRERRGLLRVLREPPSQLGRELLVVVVQS